jgi:hypothetical protein
MACPPQQCPEEDQEVRVRIAKADETQLLICLKHRLWGRSRNKFRDWRPGDYLAILTDAGYCALVQISDEPFVSEDLIFEKAFFPYRIPLLFVHLVKPENAHLLAQQIRAALVPTWGTRTGFPILLQLLLPGAAGRRVVDTIRSRPNSLTDIESRIGDVVPPER